MCSRRSMRWPMRKPRRARYSQIGARTRVRLCSRRASSPLALLIGAVDDRPGDRLLEQVETEERRGGALGQVQLLGADGVHDGVVAVYPVTWRWGCADETLLSCIVRQSHCPTGQFTAVAGTGR